MKIYWGISFFHKIIKNGGLYEKMSLIKTVSHFLHTIFILLTYIIFILLSIIVKEVE